MKNDDLYLEQLLVGPMDNFIYLVGSKSTREVALIDPCLLYTSPSPRDLSTSRMPSSA